MKIVVLDGYTLNPGDNPWDEIAAQGELIVYDRTAPESVFERARDAEILLTNKTPLRAEILEQLPALRFVAVLATGYNVVDVAFAARIGVPVANVPEYGTDSVAQHVFALLLELCHQVARHDTAVKAGEWTAAPDFCFWRQSPQELAGLTMGIVGFGRIGRRVAELAHAFRMSVLAHTRTRRDAPRNGPFEWVEVPRLFERADVISLHCPLTADNDRFVNQELLGRVRPGCILINTARGGLVDEAALARALASGPLGGAAVDVVSTEPIRPDNPLLRAPNCLITPHMAWGSLAARRRLMEATARNIQAFLAGQPINVVA